VRARGGVLALSVVPPRERSDHTEDDWSVGPDTRGGGIETEEREEEEEEEETDKTDETDGGKEEEER